MLRARNIHVSAGVRSSAYVGGLIGWNAGGQQHRENLSCSGPTAEHDFKTADSIAMDMSTLSLGTDPSGSRRY